MTGDQRTALDAIRAEAKRVGARLGEQAARVAAEINSRIDRIKDKKLRESARRGCWGDRTDAS